MPFIRLRSICLRLILLLVPAVVGLEVIAGAGLFEVVDRSLTRSLDATLAARADALAAAVHMEDDGRPHLETVPNSGGDEGSRCTFRIRRADGTTVAQSAVPPPDFDGRRRNPGNIRLPGCGYGRALVLSFDAQPDEDAFDRAGLVKPGERLTLVVAADRRGIDRPLGALLWGLVLTTVAAAGGSVVVVWWGVRRGLSPLAAAVARSEAIGPNNLRDRFDVDRLPAELAPMGSKLNELLDRLEAAFVRERRFAADVAHELRTPIAELRTACEVAVRYPGASTDRSAVAESLAIAVQMQATVSAVLSMVRCQAGLETPAAAPVDLPAMISRLVTAVEKVGAARGIAITVESVPAVVRTDAGMLTVVLRNLLENAVEYCPAGGSVRVAVEICDGHPYVVIGNTNTTLDAADLARLGEPFWRKDPARTGTAHVGLGLSIIETYCGALGVTLEKTLPRAGWFEVRLAV